MKRDAAYLILEKDAIKMGNGDSMVDVATACHAIDFARSDERQKSLAGWQPVTKPPLDEIVEVLFSDGKMDKMLGSHIKNWLYPYISEHYVVAWRLCSE